MIVYQQEDMWIQKLAKTINFSYNKKLSYFEAAHIIFISEIIDPTT